MSDTSGTIQTLVFLAYACFSFFMVRLCLRIRPNSGSDTPHVRLNYSGRRVHEITHPK